MSESREAKASAVFALMESGKSMKESCREAGVPSGTFMGWIAADTALADQYARARDSMIDAIADETLTIADATPAVLDSASVAKQRLQVDTRKWLLSKLAPKKYGDRVEIAGDPDSPVRACLRVEFVRPEKTE